jgi:hypothetical protein
MDDSATNQRTEIEKVVDDHAKGLCSFSLVSIDVVAKYSSRARRDMSSQDKSVEVREAFQPYFGVAPSLMDAKQLGL